MEKITLQHRFARALMIGAAGGAVALALLSQERALYWEWSIVRCAAAGAFLAGLMVARGFGGTGAWMWFRAGFFFSFATVLGAIIAICLLPLDAMIAERDLWRYVGITAISPFAVFSFMTDALPTGAVLTLTWGAGLAASALTARAPDLGTDGRASTTNDPRSTSL